MKKIVKHILNLAGLKISRIHKKSDDSKTKNLINFNDAFDMQKSLLKQTQGCITIFDIGAYNGETALKYNDHFPKSNIYAFEPFPNSYADLVSNTDQYQNIYAINKGVADKEGISSFNSNKFAPTNSLLDTHEDGASVWGTDLLDTVRTINVELTTVDSFVEINNIEKIDILKMDVQGAEYLVLEGAKKSIEKGIIKLIYTEIMTLPTYKGQRHFDEMIKLMRTYGFSLFNLYNFSLMKNGQLRNIDAIFLKDKDND